MLTAGASEFLRARADIATVCCYWKTSATIQARMGEYTQILNCRG